jgi:hypothetical protein
MSTYKAGDYVKVEFSDESTGIGEWMWLRVDRCDEQKQLVLGTLDIGLGSELAVSFSPMRMPANS